MDKSVINFVPALRAQEASSPLGCDGLQQDALAKHGKAALTSILLGFAGNLQASVLDARRMLDQQPELPWGQFYRLVHLLIGQDSLKLSDFFVRLGKLTDQVRLGRLSVDDGLLRTDYLIRELCADLLKFCPITGVNGCPRYPQRIGDSTEHGPNSDGHGGTHAQ